MIRIEEFIEEFGTGVNTLMEFRINREDIRVLISPFVFQKLKEGFNDYYQKNMGPTFWDLMVQKAKFNQITLLGVTFGPTDGWPNFNIMLSFRDADIIAHKVKPIILESRKWL